MNWEQAIDPVSGQCYYANRSTGETSWTPPPHFFPPPPPIPPPPPQHQQHQGIIGQTISPAITQAAQAQPLNLQHNNTSLHSTSNGNNTATYNLDSSTATTPSLLVPSIRAIIDKEHNTQKERKRKIELEGVSAGTIADLCNISMEWRSRNVHIDGGDFSSTDQNDATSTSDEAANHYYKPLQPFSLPLQSRPPHIEEGRIGIRIHSLYSKLGRI